MDDKLKSALSQPHIPVPSPDARQRALDAAMAAFSAQQDEAATQAEKKSLQGMFRGARLRSIASTLKGIWTMDMRIPLGATFAAILVLPLGVMFLNQTALTPPQQGPVFSDPVETKAETDADRSRESAELAAAPMPQPVTPAAPSPLIDAAPAGNMALTRSMPMQGFTPLGDTFAQFDEGGIQMVAENPVSTFSIDVDTASYAYVRRMLEMGQLPQADAVRVEELINYFSYDYALPDGDMPFETSVAISPSPWNDQNRLIQIGIQGDAIDLDTVPPANLVLLIDTSGSMDAPDKLPLLKRAFALLVNEMGPDDTISIVTYAGSAGVVLEPTPASQKATILQAIEDLRPGGSTAGAEGIEAAYRLAEQAMIEGGTNRVLLATDGDFNVGLSDPDGLESFIETKRDAGIFLSVLGFGIGNYNDAIMQSLAQAGNGNAAYIDSYSEARKVLVEEMGGTLLTIAKDVKIQVEFNSETVSEYRLIGYETRALEREDFNNDAVDAGDIGAGHSVTAIYEITPVGARGAVDPLRYGAGDTAASGGAFDELGFLKLRYKAPDADVSRLIETPMMVDMVSGIDAADVDFATAVAAFGQKLRGSTHVRAIDWDEIRALAVAGRGDDPTGRRAEFIRLVDLAAGL